MQQPKKGIPALESQLRAYSAAAAARSSAAWSARLNRWPLYAAATGAALAFTTSADASVITGFANVTASVPVPLSAGTVTSTGAFINFGVFPGIGTLNSGQVYATMFIHYKVNTYSSGAVRLRRGAVQFEMSSLAPAGLFITSSSVLKRFTTGATIAPPPGRTSGGGTFSNVDSSARTLGYRVVVSNIAGGGGTTLGPFLPGVTGLAGFQLGNGDIGWIQLKWTAGADGFPVSVYAGNWAINTVPGQGLYAGTDNVAPEPGTFPLALLASGFAGILAWRKRRKSQPSAAPPATSGPAA